MYYNLFNYIVKTTTTVAVKVLSTIEKYYVKVYCDLLDIIGKVSFFFRIYITFMFVRKVLPFVRTWFIFHEFF